MSRSYSKWYQLKQHAYVYIVVISNIVAEISKVKVIYKVVSTLTTYSRIQNCIIIVDQAPKVLTFSYLKWFHLDQHTHVHKIAICTGSETFKVMTFTYSMKF